MLTKILKENYTKDDFIKFILDNEIFYEFVLWSSLERKKDERNKESDKFLQELEI